MVGGLIDSHVHVLHYDIPQHGGLVGPGYVCGRVLRAGHDNSDCRNQAQTPVAGLPGNSVKKSESYAQHH